MKKIYEQKTDHAGTSEGARQRPGVGIGEIRPRSSVLGLEDEAAVPGIHAVYVASVASAKAAKTQSGVGGDFADAVDGLDQVGDPLPVASVETAALPL